MNSVWSADAVAAIADKPFATMPLIDRAAVVPILPGFDLWDYWPVQEIDGRTAEIAGGALCMLLSAPVLPDPDARHALARLRLMHQTATGWRDLGPLLPDGLAPGSREWSGSAIVSPAHDRVTLYFTAAGHRGEAEVTFAQRLFECSAPLAVSAGVPSLGPWSEPVESVVADGAVYTRDMAGGGAIGTIKAFRDPAWFRDPADGAEYLVFAASLAASASPWNGAVGLARREQGHWTLCPRRSRRMGSTTSLNARISFTTPALLLLLVDPAEGLRAAWPCRTERALWHGGRGDGRAMAAAQWHRAGVRQSCRGTDSGL